MSVGSCSSPRVWARALGSRPPPLHPSLSPPLPQQQQPEASEQNEQETKHNGPNPPAAPENSNPTQTSNNAPEHAVTLKSLPLLPSYLPASQPPKLLAQTHVHWMAEAAPKSTPRLLLPLTTCLHPFPPPPAPAPKRLKNHSGRILPESTARAVEPSQDTSLFRSHRWEMKGKDALILEKILLR